jgi:two-component system phosphate regulon sensor histidine kinase PhoR
MPDMIPTELNVNQLLRDVRTRLAPAIEQKQLHLELQLYQVLPPVEASEEGLYRALMNLVENAVNYTPEQGKVTVQTMLQDGGIVIQVSDTGIGIPSDELPMIFERFYRSAEARRIVSTGTGLGLAIVKRIIELHNGRIDVESIEGAGTTFRVWLPLSAQLAAT